MQSLFVTNGKSSLLVFLFFLAPILSFGQEKKSVPLARTRDRSCPKAYISVSTGINNEAGITGVGVDVPIPNTPISLGAGVGVSSWGDKVYGELRYYLSPCQRGWAFGVGVSHNTGLTNFTTNMSTYYGDEPVTLNLDAQTNLFFKVYRFWNLGRRMNRFYISFGWSVPITTPGYEEVAGDPLSQDGLNEMKLLEPGGLVLGVGWSFGLH